MAEEKEDEKAQQEQREKILELQSEASRKRELLDRLKEKKSSLDEELKERSNDKQSLEEDIDRERRRQTDSRENRHDSNLQDEAVSKYIESEVLTNLKDRIPAFSADDQEAEESDSDDAADAGNEAQEDSTKKIHESVVVTYLAMNPQEREVLDEYRVTYRVDKVTTGHMMHADACEFWGCSKDEFKLCIPDKGDKNPAAKGEPVPMDEEQLATVLIDDQILPPTARAHLILCHHKVLQDRKDLLKKTPGKYDMDKIIERQKGSEDDAAALTTIQHGGKAKEQQEEDMYASAFTKWPGVYNLLRHKAKPPSKKWNHIKCRDLFLYALLITLTGLLQMMRYSRDYYWIRHGVYETIGTGVMVRMNGAPTTTTTTTTSTTTTTTLGQGTTSTTTTTLYQPPIQMYQAPSNCKTTGPQNIRTVKQYGDIWCWVVNNFAQQIFNTNSTLRGFYKPMGFLRVRQQMSKHMENCRRKELSDEQRGGSCNHIAVMQHTQDKHRLIIDPQQWIVPGASGRMPTPDPLEWVDDTADLVNLPGYLQTHYDGSGYTVDYDLSNPNTQTTFLNDMNTFRKKWLTEHSRVLIFDLLLANYNMAGFVSSIFMFEISASGSVMPTAFVQPLNLGTDVGGGDIAIVLDIIRLLIVLYILTIQVMSETTYKASQGRSGLSYVFSFAGLLDASTVGLYFALSYMRFKHDPPDPSKLKSFYSYSYDADVHERLFVAEGVFILFLFIRFGTFMRLNPFIDQYWKMFGRAGKMYMYWLTIFIPLFLGAIVFANCIWSPYILNFSTWWSTFVSLVFFIRQDFDMTKMYESNMTWTILFISYFYLLMVCFLINGFLAITVHTYWQVIITDGRPKETKSWSADQWADWILAGPIYRIIMRKKPGASRREDGGEGDEDGDGEEDSDDDGDDDKAD